MMLAVGVWLGLASCTTTTAEGINQRIYAADQAVTSIVSSTDAALNAHLISKKDAQSVSAIAHQVIPLLDSARVAVAATDTAGAERTMGLVNSLLAGLQAYVPKAPAAPTTNP